MTVLKGECLLNNFRRNGSGYYDPTAFQAIVNVEKERERRNMEIYRGDIFYLTGKSKDYGKNVQDQDRPCIVVSNDKANTYSPVIEVVFLTTEDKKPLPTHVDVMCQIPSTALCEQVHSVNKSRLGTFIRSCSDVEMAAIDKALMISLGLDEFEIKPKGNLEGAVKALNEVNDELKMKLEGAERELEELKNQPVFTPDPEEVVKLKAQVEMLERQNERLLDRLVG